MSTINVDNINPASQSQVTIGPLNLTGTVETGAFTASAVLNVEVNGVPYKLLLAETTTPSNSFMFTVNTAIAGSSSNNQFTIPTFVGAGFNDLTYNYTVTTSEQTLTNQTGDVTLTWATPGTYSVEITGDFPAIYFNNGIFYPSNSGDRLKILEIQRWGDITWGSITNVNPRLNISFMNCDNLDVTATDTPNLSNCTSLHNTFYGCGSLVNSNGSIGLWNVSTITWMEGIFDHFITTSSFNVDLSAWNVSNVTNFNAMFSGCEVFNQNIGSWNVSSAVTMSNMFVGCYDFNQNIGSWNVSNVVTMSDMFRMCHSFNQNIGSWDVSNVFNMGSMFEDCYVFNQSLNNWNVSNVLAMFNMFKNCYAFNGDISSWTINNVEEVFMFSMFLGATSFNVSIGNWDVSAVTDMNNMFNGATSFNQDIGGWNVQNVTNMSFMFKNATSFNQYIGLWNVVNVTTMESMFQNSTSFNQQLDAWSLTNVNNMTNFMSGKSTANYSYYDDLLINFEATIAQSGVTLDMGTIQYTSTGATSRQNIIDNYSWTINDGGQI